MANPYYATVTTAGTSIWLPDYRISPFNVNVQVIVPVGTTVSYEVDFTLIDPNFFNQTIPVNWVVSTQFPAASSATVTGAFTSPIAGLRFNVASISGGPIYIAALQGDFIGT